MFLRCFLALVLVCLGSWSVPCQSWETQDEVAFARNLARYRLFDLATAHLEKLSKQASNPADQLLLQYGQAQIEMLAGEYSEAREDQVGFFQQAIKSLEQVVAKAGEDHAQFRRARADLARTHRRLGEILSDLMRAGVDPAANKANADKSFMRAVEILLEIQGENEQELKQTLAEIEQEQSSSAPDTDPASEADRAEDAKVAACEPLADLVETYYSWALLYEKTEPKRLDCLAQCIDKATEFIWVIGNDNFAARKVFLYEGLAHLEMGRNEEGFARLDFIIGKESGIPFLLGLENNKHLAEPIVRELTSLYERTLLSLGSFYNREQQYEKTIELGKTLEEYYRQFGPRGGTKGDFGEQFQLELGIARYRNGDSSGMALLEEISNAHQSDAVGRRAGEYISALLSGSGAASGSNAPEQRISASTWMTAADTDYKAGRYFDAIDKYQEVLGALDMISSETEKHAAAISSWNQIGNCYRGLHRYVECSVAYREGFSRATVAGDRTLVEKLAVAWYNSLVLRFKETRDEYTRELKDAAMKDLARVGVENLGFLSARDDFEQARSLPADDKVRQATLADAVEAFKSVKVEDPNYERALVYLARCEAEMGRLQEALQLLDAFDQYFANHPHARGRQHDLARQRARTESTYYRADYLARSHEHEKALTVLDRFEETHEEQKDFFAAVNYQRIKSYVALDRFEDAEKIFESCKVRAATDAGYALPPGAQYYIAQGLTASAEKADKEGRKDVASALRRRFIDQMYAYCASTGFQSYAHLRSVGDACYLIGDWKLVEKHYGDLLQRFSSSSENKSDINQTVKRRVAEAFMNQEPPDFEQASRLYKEQLELFPDSPSVIRSAALCFGGWVKLTAGKAEEVAGSGDYKEAVALWDRYFKQGIRPEDRTDKTPRYWQTKFFTIYSRYRARELDASYGEDAKFLMKNLESTVLNSYPKEEWARTFGGEDVQAGVEWKARFEYLIQRMSAL